MPDVIGSFTRGFGIGEGIVDRANQRERQKTLQGREDQLWDQSQEDRKTRLADAQTQRERSDTLWDQTQEDRKAQQSRQKTLQGREDQLWNRQTNKYNRELELANRKEGERLTGEWLNSMSEQGGYIEPPAGLEKYWDNNPHLDITNLLTPESVTGRLQAKQVAMKMMKGENVDRTDPALLNSINQLFPEIANNPSLPTEYQGKQVTNREISAVDIAPGGEGLMITQRLTLDDGSTVEVPVTENRSSDPSDNVSILPFNMVTNRLSTLDGLDLAFDEDMKAQLYSSRIMRGLTKAGGDSKDKSQIQKQMLSALDTINSNENEALQSAVDDQERQMISAQYEKLRQRTRNTYAQYLGEAGQTTSRTDSKQFKSDIKVLENAVTGAGVKWTPQLKGEVEQAYRQGATFEEIMEVVEEKYGSTDTQESADAVLNEILGGTNPSLTGNDLITPEQIQAARQEGAQYTPPTEFTNRPRNQPSQVEIPAETLANIDRLESMGRG